MEAVDTATRRSAALPPVFSLDAEKIKREEAEYQRKNTAAAMISPSFPYSCPPPPYSHAPSTANSLSSTHSGLISPPESRRTSGDEPPLPPAPARQSLPSISEALGTDPLIRYPPPPPPPPPAPTPAPTSTPAFPQSAPVTTTSDPTRLPQPPLSRPQEPPNPYSQPPPHSPMNSQSSAASAPQPGTPFSSHTTKLPTLHPLNTGQSPVNQFRPSPSYPPPSSAQEPQSAPVAQSYPYPSYPSPYQYPPPSAPTSAPVYQPTAQTAPPFPPSQWRTDVFSDPERRPLPGKIAGPAPAYGEVVKRQLDIFDLEGSLNEIAECSGKLLDFSRLYGQRAHQTARSGPIPGSIPTIGDIDDLLTKNQKIGDSLRRMRDVVIAQNQVFAEQRKDQGPPTANGYGGEPNGYQQDETKQGGFAGADPKKRRGRAAPPGRCHSCNRAETPEWRRGPDGARTLCNACGLHYAKLTRKMGGNKAAIGSSNIRPKGPGSPTV